nr:immunoglobulin light chain junction region [Macaca mulatta]
CQVWDISSEHGLF